MAQLYMQGLRRVPKMSAQYASIMPQYDIISLNMPEHD